MDLKELLSQRGIKSALIVDDAIDKVPLAEDLAGLEDLWANFRDDLSEEHRQLIDDRIPEATSRDFDENITDDGYVGAIWSLREQLGAAAHSLFERYIDSQRADMHYVGLVREKLEKLNLQCIERGRSFINDAQHVDLIVIDLYLGGAQNGAAFNLSKSLLSTAVKTRAGNPPMVVLMSRSGRLEENRNEFRDEVKLIDSGFRVLKKSDLEDSDRLERQLERLADNAGDTRKLAHFFHSLELGINDAATRTLSVMRRLQLSDIGQIQQLLLQFEGEPAGSYLVDIFDRVLQHEIEAEPAIIDSAIALNQFIAAKHPSPYLAGSSELQDLVQRTLSQNRKRLALKASPESPVAFGDVLIKVKEQSMPGAEGNGTNTDLPISSSNTCCGEVLLVLTPACDLQRSGAHRVLFLAGELFPVSRTAWKYSSDARTPAICIDDKLLSIEWDLKHIDTMSWSQLHSTLEEGKVRVVARLREAHALEIQQKLLSGLGRVGLVAPLPATFPLNIHAFVPDINGVPKLLDVPAFKQGAVCFVGRDKNSNQVIRLVLTEDGCDGLQDSLQAIPDDQVEQNALKALKSIRESGELRRLLLNGIDLTKVNASRWTPILPIETPAGVSHMAQIAWNFSVPDTPIPRKELHKSGVLILLTDADLQNEVPGLNDVIRYGAVHTEREEKSETEESQIELKSEHLQETAQESNTSSTSEPNNSQA
jgi:hypothetical protein